PFRRGDVGLRRDPALGGGFRGLVGVQAPVAEELVKALARRVAERARDVALHASVLIRGERRVEVRIGAGGSHADAAGAFGCGSRVDVVSLAAFTAVRGGFAR